MLFRKGNQNSSWDRLARPCTIATGMRNRTVRTMLVTIITTLDIHLCKNVEWKNGQYTSFGSGACSVTHSVGFSDCCKREAIAAPNRDLKDTKAERTSFTIARSTKQVCQQHQTTTITRDKCRQS